jgi:hypothetical protein
MKFTPVFSFSEDFLTRIADRETAVTLSSTVGNQALYQSYNIFSDKENELTEYSSFIFENLDSERDEQLRSLYKLTPYEIRVVSENITHHTYIFEYSIPRRDIDKYWEALRNLADNVKILTYTREDSQCISIQKIGSLIQIDSIFRHIYTEYIGDQMNKDEEDRVNLYTNIADVATALQCEEVTIDIVRNHAMGL